MAKFKKTEPSAQSDTMYLVSDNMPTEGVKIGRYQFKPGVPTEVPAGIAQDIMNRKKSFNFKQTTKGGES